jgi:hypothetical protein
LGSYTVLVVVLLETDLRTASVSWRWFSGLAVFTNSLPGLSIDDNFVGYWLLLRLPLLLLFIHFNISLLNSGAEAPLS